MWSCGIWYAVLAIPTQSSSYHINSSTEISSDFLAFHFLLSSGVKGLEYMNNGPFQRASLVKPPQHLRKSLFLSPSEYSTRSMPIVQEPCSDNQALTDNPNSKMTHQLRTEPRELGIQCLHCGAGCGKNPAYMSTGGPA